MIVNPSLGQTVQIWYAARTRDRAPLHGKLGVVAIVSRGKPRNHGVIIDGTLCVVPCGQLQGEIRALSPRKGTSAMLPGF